MKIDKQIADFIQMRIEGKSFDEIAKVLNTAKSTLIDWNKKADVRTLIVDGRAFALNTIIKAYQYDKQARLKTMLEIANKIHSELAGRSFALISTDKLLQMSIANDSRIMKAIDTKIEIGENTEFVFFGNKDGFFDFTLDE